MIVFNDLNATIIDDDDDDDDELVKSYFLRWYCFSRVSTMEVKDREAFRLSSSPILLNKAISNCSASSF